MNPFNALNEKIDTLNANMTAQFSLVMAAIQTVSMPIAPLSIWTEMVKNDYVDIHVYIKGSEIWQLQAFGADVYYDSNVLEFVDSLPGQFTENWSIEGENIIEPGHGRFGAVAGTVQPIEGAQIGSIAILRFSLIDPQFSGQTEIKLDDYVDDLEPMTPKPYTKTIEL